MNRLNDEKAFKAKCREPRIEMNEGRKERAEIFVCFYSALSSIYVVGSILWLV